MKKYLQNHNIYSQGRVYLSHEARGTGHHRAGSSGDRGSKMANFKYFQDTENGETVELTAIAHDGGGTRAKNFSGLNGMGVRVTATRKIEYKANPSKHVCDDRCVNATGRVMKCECSCGGKNHGKGGAK